MTTYVGALSFYLFFSICFFFTFYLRFAHLKDCGYLKETVYTFLINKLTIRHFQTTNVFLVSDIIMQIPIAELTLLVVETFNTFEYCL